MLKIASTPLGDLGEVMAAKKVFGDHAHKLAMSSTNSTTGHLLGAAGGVEVPCAVTYCTSEGLRPASFKAVCMQRAARSPPSLGAVMWNASPLMPKPTSSA